MTITLLPDEVEKKYGKMFCKSFMTLVDENTGSGRIIETCSARGPCEWDIVNRKRTGGVITDIDLEGTTMIMETVLGEKKLNFGPVSKNLGGQGIEKMIVEGDEVRTTWYGIAGAGVGVGACIPQCSDVIRAEYPEDMKIGGAHKVHLDIITPKLVRVVIGMDDTDTKEKGATWAEALKMALNCPIGHMMDHKITQLNPLVPTKTTNCCSSAVSFAVRESEVPALVEYCEDYIKKNSYSDGAVMTVFKGLNIPKRLSDFGWSAKSIIYQNEDAIKVAQENGVQIIQITGDKGTIGAVAAIGCYDIGLRAAGVPEDFD